MLPHLKEQKKKRKRGRERERGLLFGICFRLCHVPMFTRPKLGFHASQITNATPHLESGIHRTKDASLKHLRTTLILFVVKRE
jgi:hypothetical protein